MGKTRNEIGQDFLRALFEPIPADSAIEIRRKKPLDQGTRQSFHVNAAAIQVEKFALDENVWMGCVLRKAGSSTGKEIDLTFAPTAWADFDHVEDVKKPQIVENLKRFAHPATLIVDSGGGVHAYWRFDRMLDMSSDTQRIYLREVVYGLAERLGSDLTVHDPTRVLRVAGTFNPGNGITKVYAPPREVKVLHYDPKAVYAVGDLSQYRRPVTLKQGERAASIPATVPAAPPLSVLVVGDKMRDLIRDGHTKGCGYPSRSELDQAAVVAMLEGGHTEEEIFATFREASYNIGSKYRDKGLDGDRYLATTIANAKAWVASKKHAIHVPGMRENNDTVEVERAKGKWETVLTAPITALARLTGEVSGYQVQIGAEERTIHAADMTSNPRFKVALDLAAAWLGQDRDIQLLTLYLDAQRPPIQHVVRTVGWAKDQVIFPNAYLVGGKLVPNSNYLYMGKLTDARLIEPRDWPVLARDMLRHVFGMHTTGATIPIAAWFMSTFVAPFVRTQPPNRGFPPLMVFGSPEAGKTTLLEMLREAAGMGGSLHSAATNTRFANIELLSSSNTLPVVYDEHRRGDVKSHVVNLYPHLREAYTADTVSRGRQDLSITRFRLTAPVCVAGETPFRDSALIDRTVHVRLDRGTKIVAANDAMHALPLEEFAVGMYRHVQQLDLPSLWTEAQIKLPSAFRDTAHFRQQHAWTVVTFGLLLVRDFLPGPVQSYIDRLSEWRGMTSDEVGVSDKIVVQEAIGALAELIRARIIRDGHEFVVREKDGEKFLWFLPALVLPQIEQHFQKYPTDLPMQREVIRGRMREDAKTPEPLVAHFMELVRIAGKPVRAIGISLAQVEKEMQIGDDYWTQTAVVGSDKL
jgi:hypothetical protein